MRFINLLLFFINLFKFVCFFPLRPHAFNIFLLKFHLCIDMHHSTDGIAHTAAFVKSSRGALGGTLYSSMGRTMIGRSTTELFLAASIAQMHQYINNYSWKFETDSMFTLLFIQVVPGMSIYQIWSWRESVFFNFANKDIIFYCIPSHVDIKGNEKADCCHVCSEFASWQRWCTI